MDLSLPGLSKAYAGGQTPSSIASSLHAALAKDDRGAVVFLIPLEDILQRCSEILNIPQESRGPLWGTFFAAKDNVDVATYPTTAGCPDFKYMATESAPCVKQLESAGAILVAKANMDQFATGLVGSRTPFGTARNPFDARFIPGGSSAGSGALVGAGLVSFALGTDTAGSGRVPAMFNGCVGMKPTVGKVSTKGVVPACRSIDCVSVFAMCVDDGAAIVRAMDTKEGLLSDSTRRTPSQVDHTLVSPFRFGVPGAEYLSFMGPGGQAVAEKFESMFQEAIERMESLGGTRVEIDFTPFSDIAGLLYGGAFVTERLSGLRNFLQNSVESPLTKEGILSDKRLLPVIAKIFSGGAKFSAVDLFDDLAKLSQLQGRTRVELAKIDIMLVPTAPAHYTCEEVKSQEIPESGSPTWGFNSNLGRFTNFVNLLDMCGVAVPSATYVHPSPGNTEANLERYSFLERSTGTSNPVLPFGVTLLAQAWADEHLWGIASEYHKATGLGCGPRKLPQ